MWRSLPATSFWKPLPSKFRRYCRCVAADLTHVFNLGPINCSQCSSGLILANAERECHNACIALTFDAGSRYETAIENGLTHFFEHMCFKGTRRRSKTAVESEMNEIGGKFRCFTSREMIGFGAECMLENVPQALDLLTDCIFNNCLSNSEIEIQKSRVYEEMLDHDTDTPSVLFDYLHSAAFQGVGLAQSVMGPTRNLYQFNASCVISYIHKMFVPERMYFTCVGPIKHDQLCNLANAYLKRPNSAPSPPPQYRFTASDVRYRDDSLNIAHVAMAVEAPPFRHADYFALQLAAAAIGAWDRSQPGSDHSSYLARAGSSGVCNSFEAFYIAYRDTGLWGTHFVTPRANVEYTVELVQSEWMRLCSTITDPELITPKQQLKWKILKQNESASGACRDLTEWVFYTNSAPSLKEKFYAIDTLQADDVRRVCYDYIYNKCPVVAAMGATEALHMYSRLRGGMHWLRV